MRAAVLLAVDEPLVIETLVPEPLGPQEVRVRIDASGVCHSDLSIATGLVPMPAPVILGHEGAGTVLEVGDRVTRVRVGDRVISSFIPACGECWYCVRDQSNFCERLLDVAMARHSRRTEGTKVFSMSGLGTFADEMISHEWSLVAVETDLPAEQLALIGCGVMTGIGAVLNTADVRAGSTVAVIGLGGVGQSVVQGARLAGAARVIAIDPVPMKRRTAAELGASDLVDPADGDVAEQVRALTGGRGADYAFEVVGRPETMVQARDLTRNGGTVVVVGMPASTPPSRSRPTRSSTTRSDCSAATTARPTSAGTFRAWCRSSRAARSTSLTWSRRRSPSTTSTRRSPTCRRARSSGASSFPLRSRETGGPALVAPAS